MRFSDSINTDFPKIIIYANSDSFSYHSDTSSSDDESYNTAHPHNPDPSLHDISSYNTINKTRDLNPSYTRSRHHTDSSSLPPSNDTSQNTHLKSQYKLRQLTTKGLQTFPFTLQSFEPLITHKILKTLNSISGSNLKK